MCGHQRVNVEGAIRVSMPNVCLWATLLDGSNLNKVSICVDASESMHQILHTKNHISARYTQQCTDMIWKSLSRGTDFFSSFEYIRL